MNVTFTKGPLFEKVEKEAYQYLAKAIAKQSKEMKGNDNRKTA